MNFIGIIPARYASTRFPGKPLAKIAGKSMIQRVYEQALSVSFKQVFVATDDTRIEKAVKDFGGKVIMTSDTHRSGTDRCAEAITIIEKIQDSHFDVIVNIQGDEPFIQPNQLNELMGCFTTKDVEIATLIKKIDSNDDVFNPNLPKVIFNTSGEAIYFSRSPIPYLRDTNRDVWHISHEFYRHIGLYAYRKDILLKLTKLAPSSLEQAESLEQNRWIENGYKINVAQTKFESIGIDTPEDLKKAEECLLNKKDDNE